MKIIEVSRGHPHFGNNKISGVFEWDQARALRDQQEIVSFFSIDLRSFRRKRKFGMTISTIDGIRVYHYSFPLGRVPFFIYNFVFSLLFKKLYKKYKMENGDCDLIHCHFALKTGYSTHRFCKKNHIKYIVTEHDSSVRQNNISRYQKRILKKVYSDSFANIAVSEDFKYYLEHEFFARFLYIPNVVDIDSFSFHARQKPQIFTFITVANLDKNKHIDLIISALSLFSNSEKRNIKLVIIGEGPEKNNLKKMCDENGLNGSVIFKGFLERKEINKELELANCFVLPSERETFGVAYIEAMLTGLPVIATKCGGPQSFVNENNGLLIDKDNQTKLFNAMKYIISHYYEYNQKNISENTRKQFSPATVGKQLIDIIYEKNN